MIAKTLVTRNVNSQAVKLEASHAIPALPAHCNFLIPPALLGLGGQTLLIVLGNLHVLRIPASQ